MVCSLSDLALAPCACRAGCPTVTGPGPSGRLDKSLRTVRTRYRNHDPAQRGFMNRARRRLLVGLTIPAVRIMPIEVGTPTFKLRAAKPSGPPLMRSDHDGNTRSSRSTESFGAGSSSISIEHGGTPTINLLATKPLGPAALKPVGPRPVEVVRNSLRFGAVPGT